MTQQSIKKTTLSTLLGVLQSLEVGRDTLVSVNGDSGVRVMVAGYKDPVMGGGPHVSLTGDNQTTDKFLAPLEHTVQFDECQRQAMLMALAHLAVERPGWDMMLEEIARKMDNNGCPMYSEFKELHQEKVVEVESPEQGA